MLFACQAQKLIKGLSDEKLRYWNDLRNIHFAMQRMHGHCDCRRRRVHGSDSDKRRSAHGHQSH
jgi:hypothetical protein